MHSGISVTDRIKNHLPLPSQTLLIPSFLVFSTSPTNPLPSPPPLPTPYHLPLPYQPPTISPLPYQPPTISPSHTNPLLSSHPLPTPYHPTNPSYLPIPYQTPPTSPNPLPSPSIFPSQTQLTFRTGSSVWVQLDASGTGTRVLGQRGPLVGETQTATPPVLGTRVLELVFCIGEHCECV